MKTYMPLNGLRWSRNSGSANCDMPQSVVFGRPGGGVFFTHKLYQQAKPLINFAASNNQIVRIYTLNRTNQ